MSNVDIARTAYEAFGRGDLAALKDAYAPDTVWWSADSVEPGGEYRGVDDIIQLMMQVPDKWSTFVIEPARYIDGGDHVVVLGNVRFGNAKGNDSSRFVQVLKFDANGKVVNSEFHSDTAKFARLQ